jgi:hypothetical protein
VKIVIELLSILSIATKEVRRRRASELSDGEILHASRLMFFQSYLPGNYWGGPILRMRIKEARSPDTGRISNGDGPDSEGRHRGQRWYAIVDQLPTPH